MMHSNFLNSEISALEENSSEESKYINGLFDCSGYHGGKMLVCMMNLSCKQELVYYSRCLVQY